MAALLMSISIDAYFDTYFKKYFRSKSKGVYSKVFVPCSYYIALDLCIDLIFLKAAVHHTLAMSYRDLRSKWIYVIS